MRLTFWLDNLNDMGEPRKYLWDDRSPSFLQIGDVAEHIARLHSGVKVDAVTHERWRQLMALLRDFDTWVDDANIPIDRAMQRLVDFTDLDGVYPALAPDAMDGNTREALLRRTRRTLLLGRMVSQAETPYRLVRLRVNEGRQTARLLADSATSDVRSQPRFTESFLPTMESLSTVACTLDSMTDARRDYQQGKIQIQPGAEYYRQLGGVTFAHAKLGARALMHGPIAKDFAIISAMRLRNRVGKHGLTDDAAH